MVLGRERCLCKSIDVGKALCGLYSIHLELDRVRVTRAYSIQHT